MSEGQTDTESETSSPSGSEQRSGAGRRVLLVEPDDATRALLEGELAQEGFHPVTVASAQDAFALFASDQLPDVVLCDVNLGGGTDGFAFCAQVRAELRSVRLPVLLLSRRREEEEAAKASTAGADDYLSTPLLVSDVLTRVKLELAERPNDHTLATRTDQVSLADATRALLVGMRSGRVEMKDGSGFYLFRRGRVISARFFDQQGEAGLSRMLTLGDGEYFVAFGPGLERGDFTLSAESFTQHLLPRVRKGQQLLDRSVPRDARLVVDFDALSLVLDQLPDGVNRVLRLFDGSRTVRQAAIDCVLDENATLEVIARLYSMGVLEPASNRRAKPNASSVASVEAFIGSVAIPPSVPDESVELLPGDGSDEDDEEDEEESILEQALLDAAESGMESLEEPSPAAAALQSAALPLGKSEPPAAAVATALELPAVSRAPEAAESAVATAPQLPAPVVPAPVVPAPVVPAPVVPAPVVPAPEPARPVSQDPVWYERQEQQVFGGAADAVTPPAAAPELNPAPASPAPVLPPEPNESLRTLTLSRQELEKSFFELELSRFARSEPESDDASVERAARAAADARARKLSQRVLFGTVAAGLVATVLLFLLFPVGRPAKPRAGESARGGSLVDVLWPGKDAAPEPAPVKQEEPEEALDPSGPTLEDGIRLYESGRPREAARVLSKVVVARPVNATAWLMLGIARFDSGDARGAEDAAKRALTLDPRNGRAIMLLASVYLADGQRELAHQQLRDYLELEPNGQYAHDARELLKQ